MSTPVRLLSEAGRVSLLGRGHSTDSSATERDRNRLAPEGSVAIGEPAIQITAGFSHSLRTARSVAGCAVGEATSFGTLGYGHADGHR